MKIAWFTPYNPHSAIGHYSEAITRELAKTNEIVIYASDAPRATPPGSPRVIALGDGPHDSQPGDLHRFDQIVYNMGDHYGHHCRIYEVLRQRPGIVVLHDLVMRDFFRGYYLTKHKDPHALACHLAYSEGAEAGPMVRAVRHGRHVEDMDDPLRLKFPMFKSVLHRCLGVVVHSEYTRARVAAACPAPVEKLDFPLFGPAVPHARAAPAPRAPHTDRVRLLTFGHLNHNKQIHTVIDCIAASDCLRANVEYTIVGQGSHEFVGQLQKAIKRNGLSDAVRLAGRLSDDGLWDMLARTDVVVNLRNPHCGESSASLLDALLAGAATVVWNHGFYAEFPDDVVCKISSSDELQHSLERLCRDPKLRARMGDEARRHALARFDTAVFCQRFLAFAEVVRYSQPVLALTDLLSDRLLEFGLQPPNDLPARLARELGLMTGAKAGALS